MTGIASWTATLSRRLKNSTGEPDLKGHGFRGCGKSLSARARTPQRLKPAIDFAALTARLKAAPLQITIVP